MTKELEKEIKRVNASFKYFCRKADSAKTAKTLEKWVMFMKINRAYYEKLIEGI